MITAALVTVLVLALARDITRAAHDNVGSRAIQNQSFGALADAYVGRSDALASQLTALLASASTSRVAFGAQLNQITTAAANLVQNAATLRSPVIAGNEQQRVIDVIDGRAAVLTSTATTVASSLALPLSPRGVVRSPGALAAAAAETNRQWAKARGVLLAQPGHVRLAASVCPLATFDVAGALSSLEASPSLALHRHLVVSAVSATPSPFPSAAGQWLLPPGTTLDVGVTVSNEAYALQNYAIAVTFTPTNGLGTAYASTFRGALGPLASAAVLPATIPTVPGESGIVKIVLTGSPTPENGSDRRTYRVFVSTSPGG